MSGETQSEVSGWTIDTLREYVLHQLNDRTQVMQQQVDMLRAMLQERYETQTKAVDAAFLAQQCVSADTPILCADLVWRPAGDLLVGDELIAFDEDSNRVTGRTGRCFRRATVTANSLQRDALLLVTTPRGSVRCNYEHPWLVKDRCNKWVWRPAHALKPGSEVMHMVDVWPVDRTWECGWLSGMADGEGWLTFAPNDASVRLGIAQSAGPTADRLLHALKDLLGGDPAITQVTPGRYHNTKLINRYQISQRADVMKFLGSVRPERLLANADRVWENKGTSGEANRTTVMAVEGAGTGRIASLSTSTRTYIAGGFAMHNTAMQTALTAAERAVATALLSAEKAVVKAETAAEKRFESVNEFRAQLADQAATFMPRAEAEARTMGNAARLGELEVRILQYASREEVSAISAITANKVEALVERFGALELRITSRLDLNQGHDAGSLDTRNTRRMDTSQLVAMAGLFIAVISILVVLYRVSTGG